MKKQVGVELVPLLKNKSTGNPRKDPNTGYMMNHSLPSSDVTRAQDPKHTELPAYPRQSPLEEKKTYYTELANQVVSKVTQKFSFIEKNRLWSFLKVASLKLTFLSFFSRFLKSCKIGQ